MNLTHIPENFRGHAAFSPVSFRNITLPGRIVRSATELFCADENGHVTEKEFKAYDELALQPFGLIITGHTCVSPEGRSNPGQNAIWDDTFIEEQSRIAASVHRGCSKIILQIGHGGMKAEHSNGGRPFYTPDNMSAGQISSTVHAFAEAAKRARICGFDGVQLHAAHLYLLSQFFYPQFNRRTDAYGGSAAGRFRIILEITEAIKTACGSSFPVFIKINGDNIMDGEQYFRDLCEAADICDRAGIEALELSGYESVKQGTPAAPYFFETALRLLRNTNLPLMLVGGIRKRAEIEEILGSGIKTVSVCRPVMQRNDFIESLFT